MNPNPSNTQTATRDTTVAVAAPEYSILVCGLSGAVSTAPSGSCSRWELGPVPDPRVNQATLNLDHLESSITLFRYTPPSFSPPGVTREMPLTQLEATANSRQLLLIFTTL